MALELTCSWRAPEKGSDRSREHFLETAWVSPAANRVFETQRPSSSCCGGHVSNRRAAIHLVSPHLHCALHSEQRHRLPFRFHRPHPEGASTVRKSPQFDGHRCNATLSWYCVACRNNRQDMREDNLLSPIPNGERFWFQTQDYLKAYFSQLWVSVPLRKCLSVRYRRWGWMWKAHRFLKILGFCFAPTATTTGAISTGNISANTSTGIPCINPLSFFASLVIGTTLTL